MAMDLTQPFDVAYPVNFKSNGDTTTAAFGKHIQEIERIYGIINALNADKISASDFTTRLASHVEDSNPHPNLDLANTVGNLATSRLSGSISMDKITGNLASSRISGNFDSSKITGNFDTSRINGLESYVKNIVSASDGSSNTWVKISGVLIQWGYNYEIPSDSGYLKQVIFPKVFDTYNVSVIATATKHITNDEMSNYNANFHISVFNISRALCYVRMSFSDYNSNTAGEKFNWIAIGH